MEGLPEPHVSETDKTGKTGPFLSLSMSRKQSQRQSEKCWCGGRVVWMWFGAFPGAFGLGRAQPQRRGTSP